MNKKRSKKIISVLRNFGVNVSMFSIFVFWSNYFYLTQIISWMDVIVSPIIIVFFSSLYGACLILLSFFCHRWFLWLCFAIFIMMNISLTCLASFLNVLNR